MASGDYIQIMVNGSDSHPRTRTSGTKLIEELKKSSGELAILKSIDLSKTHVAFEGTPQKHPLDEGIIILVNNPFDNRPNFYEFSLDSITHVEDMGIMTNEEGNTVSRARVWVKKGLPALKAEAFIVS